MLRLLRPVFRFTQPQPPKSKMAQLSNRSLLILNGPDTHKLLQGLITNDIKELKTVKYQTFEFERIALYTLFLQSKGKVITDAFVVKPKINKQNGAEWAEQQLWLDIPTQNKGTLKEHLRRHSWKKKVQVTDTDAEMEVQGFKPLVYSGSNEQNMVMESMLGGAVQREQEQKGEPDTYANMIYFDPRGPQFGIRVISNQQEMQIQGHFDRITQEEHRKLFATLGEVPSSFMKNKLPFQFNTDLMHGFNLKKGCFLGQQIVSRGMLTGIIRRRVFPFQCEGTIEMGETLKGPDGAAIGKVVTSEGRVGLALINYLSYMENNTKWPIEIKSPFPGKLLSPFEIKLNKYYDEMKDKQRVLEELDL